MQEDKIILEIEKYKQKYINEISAIIELDEKLGFNELTRRMYKVKDTSKYVLAIERAKELYIEFIENIKRVRSNN